MLLTSFFEGKVAWLAALLMMFYLLSAIFCSLSYKQNMGTYLYLPLLINYSLKTD